LSRKRRMERDPTHGWSRKVARQRRQTVLADDPDLWSASVEFCVAVMRRA
jgi:hypothetical protein